MRRAAAAAPGDRERRCETPPGRRQPLLPRRQKEIRPAAPKPEPPGKRGRKGCSGRSRWRDISAPFPGCSRPASRRRTRRPLLRSPPSRRRLLALLAAAVLALCSFAKGSRPKFPRSALYEIDVGLDDPAVFSSGTVVAFADFNEDKFTDLIVLSGDQKRISVLTWNHAAYRYDRSRAGVEVAGFTVTNVVPGDFDYDGKLDLLVMGQNDPVGGPEGELKLRIYFGNGIDAFESDPLELASSQPAQPIVMDLNGDMRPDLVGYPVGTTSVMSVWKNRAPAPGETGRVVFENPSPISGASATPFCKMSNPHFGAFIDLDGDCLADLFLTCEPLSPSAPPSYQIWLNSKADGLRLGGSKSFPQGAGPVSFADMNRDGTVDMLFPVCTQGKCTVRVAYNRQMPLCSSKDEENGRNCRSATDLCTADPTFSFSMQEGEDHVVLDMTSILGGHTIMLRDPSFAGVWPVPLRAGDFNLDGYPDLLVVDESGQMYMLASEPCSEAAGCSSIDTEAAKRTFKRLEDESALGPVAELHDVHAAAFLDLDEDGTLDIMILRSDPHVTDPLGSSSRASRQVKMITNNFFNDAFFMKTLVLNGVCPSWCETEVKFPSPKPYGVSYTGASFKYMITDTVGVKRVTQVAQLPQTSYVSLHTPYSLFGLGRTNNYLEALFVGSTRHQEKHYNSWQGVVPNSQLIIVPYQPSGVADPSSWRMELYINPSDYAVWVVIVLVASMAMLSALVFVLNWMEKREDEQEKQRNQFRINFDAL